MLGWVILIVVAYVLYRFFREYSKDSEDLSHETLHKKFSVIVHTINEAAFDGNGKITTLDKRNFNLYREGENQIIDFLYGTGHLTITWKYKYFQKEVVHSKQFPNCRNLSNFEQQRIANIMIREMAEVIQGHKKVVIEGASLRPKSWIELEMLRDLLRDRIIKNTIAAVEGNPNQTEEIEDTAAVVNAIIAASNDCRRCFFRINWDGD
ncbi:MAG: hypothetical protein U0176_16990 [Bacteroidia bacterium]